MNRGVTDTLNTALEGLIEVQTPDRVVFYHPMAGISLRGTACVVDMAVQLAMLLTLAMIGGILSLFVGAVARLVQWAGDVLPITWLWAVLFLLMWMVYTGYFVAFETVWNGQTPGKRLLGVRVLKDNGGPIGFYEALLRNLLRIVDSVPSFYAVGVITALCTSREQRLGDIVAGTVVVREPTFPSPAPEVFIREVSEEGREFEPLTGLDRLEEEDLVLVRDFLERRRSLGPSQRAELSIAIATAAARKMRFSHPGRVAAEKFLEAVLFQAVGLEEPAARSVEGTQRPVEEGAEQTAEPSEEPDWSRTEFWPEPAGPDADTHPA